MALSEAWSWAHWLGYVHGDSNFSGSTVLDIGFAPTINWSLHQLPEVWTDLASAGDLALASSRWLVPRRALRLARVFGTEVGVWLLTSHFLLTFRLAASVTASRKRLDGKAQGPPVREPQGVER
jgi:hypothetical protein